ncbi:MAG: ATP-binding cassette domain-containing protein [Proteobacteria bacterium]|nr:ATP-binding cassette domain-containing protein [Pseudomonadota bacterium]
MEIINAKLQTLFIDKFTAKPGEAWCLVGANRSGIDDFFTLLTGENQGTTAQLIDPPQNMGIVSFGRQQALFEEELKKDDTDFLDRMDPGTLAGSFLENPQKHAGLINAFGMEGSMTKGYRQLSSGQARKLLLLAQITKGVSCLAVQAPYEGLDPHSCAELDKAMALLHQHGIGLFITVHNYCDIPDWCTHVGLIANGLLEFMGPRADIMAALEVKTLQGHPDFTASLAEVILDKTLAGTPHGTGRSEAGKPEPPRVTTELVQLKNGSAGYGGNLIFSGLNLRIRTGEHTLVTGPNGSGKSTLLQLITGDHPACYQNDLRIFGIQRGTGESIWELKSHMGIVSPDLHRNYHVPGNTLQCILSGLFDSIGLYQTYTRQEELAAEKWLARTGLSREARTPFRQLGYADQRLALIARALIKVPRLLILDEPTQGLDALNRTAVLNFLEQVAKEGLSTLLYVSHRQDEHRDFFKCRIRL